MSDNPMLLNPPFGDSSPAAPTLAMLMAHRLFVGNRKAFVEGSLLRFPNARKPNAVRTARTPTPDGLLNLKQAAARLGIGVSLLREHVKAGRLKFIDVGKGGERRSIRFARADLDEFTTKQRTSGEIPPCPSSSRPARRSGTTTFNSKVIAFTALPRPRTNAKPKP